MVLKEQGEKKVYSDGTETEQKMLQIAQQFPEDKAEDYIANDSAYTINNTFSSVRRNILNWYPFKEHASVLEVGAGMGSITGLLCDAAEFVTSIEMNDARADVIRARYAQRENLTVISEDINTWDTDQCFDYVVFIGVLEYAAVFSDALRPYDEFLFSVRRLLKPDGIVLFAIENRFGLKYWLGASEDHLQVPFVGVSGYPDKKSPRTFSKKELEVILDRVGLDNHRFYAVLPDYKFPELIFFEESKPDPMNLKKVSFTYSKNSALYADEKKLYRDIVENGVFPFFANSFLVEASVGPLPERYITHVSSKGEVYKEYRVSTVIDNAGNVYKQPMHKDAVFHIRRIQKNTEYLKNRGVPILPVEMEGNCLKSKFHKGQGAQQMLRQALSDNDILTIHKLLDCLRDSFLKSSETVEYNINNFLVEHNIAQPGVDYGRILQKAFVDMTFYNAFWEGEELLFYDQEWCVERLPLHFCLYYAVKSAYTRAEVDTVITLDSLMEYMGISPEEYGSYEKTEEVIWSKVLYRQTDFYGADGYCNRYGDELLLETKIKDAEETGHQNEKYKRQMEGLLAEYESNKEQLVTTQQYLSQSQQRITELRDSLEHMAKDAASQVRTIDHLEQELEGKNLQLSVEKQMSETISTELKVSEQKHRNELAELRQTVLNKEGHIQQLLEVEREYQREKHSRTYRTALVLRRISTFFLPVDSKRRFFCKLLAKAVRHPIRMIRMVNLRRIKNCFTILRTEGTESASLHLRLVEEFERSGSADAALEKLDIAQVEPSPEQPRSLEDYSPLVFTLPEKPLVSIVIPAYNQFDYTYHCLESILKHSGDAAYEILLADDCSTDLTTEIQKVVTGIRCIRNRENLRFLHSCNNAARQVKGKYILFLNNDTQVQENWLLPLVELLEADASIGMTGSKLVYPDGRLQEAGGIFWKDASAWNYGHLQNPEDPEYNYVKEADYISGAAVMIRRSLWEEIGGFDERFAPAYYEDSDLAFEVRRHGYKVVYQPLSVVVHFEGVSNGTDLTAGQKKYQAVNQQKFYDKWKDVLEAEHFPNGENVFLAKDRSRGRKQILVVDHYVPHHDKDAGGKCTYMYLQLFVQMGFKVTFIGDNFYRHEPYTTDLNQQGIEVLYGNYYYNNWEQWLKDNLHYFDYVYLQRPHISVKYIDLVKQYGHAKVFYFAHDLHHVREYREYLLTHDEEKRRSAAHWKQIEYELFEKADVGHVVGSYEQGVMQEAFPGKPIRNIPLYIYKEMPAYVNKDFAGRHDLIYVGGFGHPPNIDAVLWFGREVFPKILEKYPQMKWHVVGGKVPGEVKELASENILIEGFLSDEELHSLYGRCRMAVVPLRVGAGVKGKVVEASYYQIPLVTTTIGAEGLDGEMGNMCVEDDGEKMAELICGLYEDYGRLKEMSDAGEAFIRKYFTVEEAERVLRSDIG